MADVSERDHRRIGKDLDLFTFSELVGAGLPLWTPRGTTLRSELDAYVWELRRAQGFERVTIPHITKRDLYEKSGHWEKFSDDLFRITSRESREYALKPMNCPHHTQIFARKPVSYRDMPQRYAETTMVYRDEQSGELGGLTRVLSITQDDSHVFCRHDQIKEEFFKTWDLVDTFYTKFGFTLKVRLSFHDPSEPQKYLGTEAVWRKAETALREIAKERAADSFEAPGEAALYGPKLDFMATDSIGREHQVATIQLDLNIPERFDLVCVNEKGEKERVAMIHSAIMGSIERFTAVLLEHLGGVLPLWLSPVQVSVLPIADAHKAYATEVYEQLKSAGIRAELDESNETLGKKVRNAKAMKVPYLLVIGDAEVAAKSAALEGRAGKEGVLPIADIIAKLKRERAERT
jgi:threonyl-tRNA synthetase